MTILQGISPARRGDKIASTIAVLATFTAAAFFYVPALKACAGDFPVPLDDVYIHFDFARALCRGHPFSWIAGQGFSSGETSPLYMVVLALGWAIGFRGEHLAVFGAGVACVSIVFSMRSLRALMGVGGVVACLASIFLVSVGALDFALFSGMEIALFVALLLHAFVMFRGVVQSAPHTRTGKQWRLGLLGALLVWTRPEAAVVIAVLAVLAARHARSQSPFAALARVASPGAIATGAIALANWIFSGDYASAGARLKLLSSNPYLSDLDRARELVLNALNFEWRVVEGSVVARPAFVWILFAAALVPLLSRRSRSVGAALLVSAGLYALLVSFNGAARFQGFRYYAPVVAMIIAAIALGVSVIARRFGSIAGVSVAAFFVGGAAWRVPAQMHFFRDASANIHDQQARLGKKLHTFDLASWHQKILIGDAGAIPYFADCDAIDALGLGGYEGRPFTRAALSGEASTLELLQRLGARERPRYLALYPNWFPLITSKFGHELERFTIEPNVICGGPTKILYTANWTPLDASDPMGDIVDELDVADVESESEHDYESPAPDGGFAIGAILRSRAGAPMFDGGRVIPEGRTEHFIALHSARVVFTMRSDADVNAAIEAGAATVSISAAAKPLEWIYAESSPIAITRGDRITVHANKPLRDFHLWMIRSN